jgi:hypothetical protein
MEEVDTFKGISIKMIIETRMKEETDKLLINRIIIVKEEE